MTKRPHSRYMRPILGFENYGLSEGFNVQPGCTTLIKRHTAHPTCLGAGEPQGQALVQPLSPLSCYDYAISTTGRPKLQITSPGLDPHEKRARKRFSEECYPMAKKGTRDGKDARVCNLKFLASSCGCNVYMSCYVLCASPPTASATSY